MTSTRKILLALLLLGGFAGAASAATAVAAGIHIGPSGHASVDLGFFYDDLAPYGYWVERPAYGWVWAPRAVPVGWRPYQEGHWVWTVDGWLWVSDEPFGWATYHYGRWYDDPDIGWAWVPDDEWGPAWVSWQEGYDHVGWAPLPPRVSVSVSFGGGYGGSSYGRYAYGLPPEHYVFVPERYFLEPSFDHYVVPRHRVRPIYYRTRNCTSYRYYGDRIYNEGVPYDRIQRRYGRRIPRYELANLEPAYRHRGARFHAGRLQVFRPEVEERWVEPPIRRPRARRAVLNAERFQRLHRGDRAVVERRFEDRRLRRADALGALSVERSADLRAGRRAQARAERLVERGERRGQVRAERLVQAQAGRERRAELRGERRGQVRTERLVQAQAGRERRAELRGERRGQARKHQLQAARSERRTELRAERQAGKVERRTQARAEREQRQLARRTDRGSDRRLGQSVERRQQAAALRASARDRQERVARDRGSRGQRERIARQERAERLERRSPQSRRDRGAAFRERAQRAERRQAFEARQERASRQRSRAMRQAEQRRERPARMERQPRWQESRQARPRRAQEPQWRAPGRERRQAFQQQQRQERRQERAARNGRGRHRPDRQHGRGGG